MAGIFDYDWFTGPAFELQKRKALELCAAKKFPDLTTDQAAEHTDYQEFLNNLDVRTLIYLRDGFSYEMKHLIDIGLRNMLTFECEPLDEQYKVGTFIVSVLFDEVVRVEVFAVHPSEKPEDTPVITGFRHRPMDAGMLRDEMREVGEPHIEAADDTETL